jgi:hypothetical protein
MKKMVIATALMSLSCSAYAEPNKYETGNFLFKYCKAAAYTDEKDRVHNSAEWLQIGICSGIVAGISDAMGVNAHTNDNSLLCANIPDGVERGQLTKVVVRYMETHPKELHFSLSSLAALALKDAWPCHK